MCLKLIFAALFFLLLEDVHLEEISCGTPFVASSTQSPASPEQINVQKILEEHVQMQKLLEKYQHRIEILELQNAKIKQPEDIADINKKLEDNNSLLLMEMKKMLQDQLNTTQNLLEQKREEILEECCKSRKLLPVVDQNQTLPKNCKDVQKRGNNLTGVYRIQPVDNVIKVFCDMDTRGGGWTYVLNRFDGSQDFYLNWNNYKFGFGEPSGEFWLGLEPLYQLTSANNNELLIELGDWEAKTVHAHYTNFMIGTEAENYSLKILNGYNGDAGDSFGGYHVGKNFSTFDHIDPLYDHCIQKYHGAWWYGPGCFHVHLTGRYQQKQVSQHATGIHWYNFHAYKYSLKSVKMMIRPRA